MQYWLFFHILGFILWAGGALNVSRMLGFHVQEDPITVQPRFSHMEKRLFTFVVLPGLALTAFTGWEMLSTVGQHHLQFRWMQVKLGLVLAMFFLTMLLGKRIQDIEAEPRIEKKGRHMALHGMIGLCVVGILWMVMVRPL